MIQREKEKILAVRKAGTALSELMFKLEKDAHLKGTGPERPVVVFLPELIAFVISGFSEDRQEILADLLVHILPPEEEAVRCRLVRGILNAAAVFAEQTAEVPGVYLALCRFDRMAMEDGGAFYRRMQVENPGRLSDCYLELWKAVAELASEAAGGDPKWQEQWERLLEMQREII